MGDTVFGPFYQVLAARGVRFEFFHEVTDLLVDDDGRGDGAVTGIRITRQAHVPVGEDYAPLVEVAALPCWPNEPLWDQLVDGDALVRRASTSSTARPSRVPRCSSSAGARTSTRWCWPSLRTCRGRVRIAPGPQSALRRHAGQCQSAMTQAAQVWTTTPLDQMGSCFGGPAIATSFVEPVDTYCDMSHLLPREVWTVGPPQGIAYFCGVMLDQPDQQSADQEVERAMLDLLTRYATILWPKTADGDGDFDWSYLFAPGVGNSPEQRLKAQYLRANFIPTERYVLSPHGLTAHRLESGKLADPGSTPRSFPQPVPGRGLDPNGVNGGCVEAATMSGMQASRAICGEPKYIVGENLDWMSRIEQ